MTANKGTFPYYRKKNKEIRPREHLTEKEVLDLLKACKETRYPIRNQTLIWVAYSHALRPSEALNLRWGQIMFDSNQIAIPRLKNGNDCIHPIWGREIRLLKKLKEEQKKQNIDSYYCFLSERGGVLAMDAFQRLLIRTGKIAGIPFQVHPHMLRHSLPTKLSNEGVNTAILKAFLGHKSIVNTERYIQISSAAFNGFFSS